MLRGHAPNGSATTALFHLEGGDIVNLRRARWLSGFRVARESLAIDRLSQGLPARRVVRHRCT